MDQKPVLVVMAAGMGSRYGGLKQVDPVGPNGALIIDYSIYDARRAGFETVVFVIKKELEETFPGYPIHMAPLSLSVACHIGPGALAVTVTKALEK